MASKKYTFHLQVVLIIIVNPHVTRNQYFCEWNEY